MICKKCGAELQDDAVICDVCGVTLAEENNEEVNNVETAVEETVEEEAVEIKAGEEEVTSKEYTDAVGEGIDIEEVEDSMEAGETADSIESEAMDIEQPAAPAKASAFARIGIPVIIVAVIAIICVVAMFMAKKGNKIVARAEYKAPEVTAGPSGEPGTAKEFKYFDENEVVKIDEQLYSYYAGQILGSMQQTYAQYGVSVDASMVESIYDSQIHNSAIENSKVVRLFEMKADEYNYEISEELRADSEKQLKEYVESLVNTAAGETYESSKDSIIRNLYGISHDDFLAAFLRVSRVAEFLEHCPEIPGITDEELTKIYEETKDSQFTTRKVKHILISTMGKDGKALGKKQIARKKALANRLAKMINKGSNIDELINKYTDDVGADGKPNNNGEYEVAGDGSYVAEFENWAMTHSPEDKAAVVKTTYGYHVMKMSVLEVTPFEEAKAILRGMKISEEGSLLAQAMEITHKNEELLNSCKANLIETLPTPAPEEEPVAESTAVAAQ